MGNPKLYRNRYGAQFLCVGYASTPSATGDVTCAVLLDEGGYEVRVPLDLFRREFTSESDREWLLSEDGFVSAEETTRWRAPREEA